MSGVEYGGLHNLVHVPEHCVGMVILGGVELEIYAMLSLTLASREYIGLKNVGLPRPVAQEFKVYLIVLCSLGRKMLPHKTHTDRVIKVKLQQLQKKPVTIIMNLLT